MEKRRYKIKPPEVWTQVRQDYLSGLDARTTAARHGVTEAALRARATKEGWSRHPRTETPLPAPPPLSPQDAADLSPDDPNDPSAHDPLELARAAAQASGRALHAQDFTQARALEAQLREAGLDPVIEREQDRRISQGIDLYLGTWRGIVTMEEWEKTLDEL